MSGREALGFVGGCGEVISSHESPLVLVLAYITKCPQLGNPLTLSTLLRYAMFAMFESHLIYIYLLLGAFKFSAKPVKDIEYASL